MPTTVGISSPPAAPVRPNLGPIDLSQLPSYAGLSPEQQAVLQNAAGILQEIMAGPRGAPTLAGLSVASRALDLYRTLYPGQSADWFRRWLPSGTSGWTPEALAAARDYFLGEVRRDPYNREALEALAASLPATVFRAPAHAPLSEQLATLAMQNALLQGYGITFNPLTGQYERSASATDYWLRGVGNYAGDLLAPGGLNPASSPAVAPGQGLPDVPQVGVTEPTSAAAVVEPPTVPAPDIPAPEGVSAPRSLVQRMFTFLNTRGLGSGSEAVALAQAYDQVFDNLLNLYQGNARALFEALNSDDFERAFLEEAAKQGQQDAARQMLLYLRSKAIARIRGY